MLLGLPSFSMLLDLDTSEMMKLLCCLEIVCIPDLLIHLAGFMKHQLCKHPLTLATLFHVHSFGYGSPGGFDLS